MAMTKIKCIRYSDENLKNKKAREYQPNICKFRKAVKY